MKFEENKYIDGYLKSNLDGLKQAVIKKWDGLLYIAGYEGDGKSTLASQICYYLDPSINLDRVCFNAVQFMEACNNAKPFQAILFDESYLTFSNRTMRSKASYSVVSLLTMIRKKQLFIIIVSPTVFDIQKYLLIHRARALIQVYADGLTRGFFGLYNRDRKLTLYIKGKKDNNMKVVKPNFTGRFTKWFPFNEEEYDLKKDIATKELSLTTEPHFKPEDQLIKEKIDHQNDILLWLRSNKLLKLGSIIKIAENYYDMRPDSFSARLSHYEKTMKNR